MSEKLLSLYLFLFHTLTQTLSHWCVVALWTRWMRMRNELITKIDHLTCFRLIKDKQENNHSTKQHTIQFENAEIHLIYFSIFCPLSRSLCQSALLCLMNFSFVVVVILFHIITYTFQSHRVSHHALIDTGSAMNEKIQLKERHRNIFFWNCLFSLCLHLCVCVWL